MWQYDPRDPGALRPPGRAVPLKPFTGTIGLAPAEPGLHSVVPPRRVGGNLDVRDLAAGSVLWLPVEVAGRALLRRRHPCGPGRRRGLRHRDRERDGGDADASSSMKRANLPFPRFTTPGPVTRHLDGAGYDVTTGIGPDLMQGARDAVSRHDRPARRRARHERRSTPTCSAPSAAICGSARSSTCRTGWCRSTCRGSSSSERERPLLAVDGPHDRDPRRGGRARVVEACRFEHRRGRDPLHRRRIRLRQVADRAGADGPPPASRRPASPAARRASTAATSSRSPSARCGGCAAATSRMIFQEPMTSLNPVMTHRQPDRRGVPRTTIAGRARPRDRAIELLTRCGIPEPAQPARAISARALRRHAAAGDDRHGARRAAEAPDRRRADHRARRDDPGPDPGPDPRPAAPNSASR